MPTLKISTVAGTVCAAVLLLTARCAFSVPVHEKGPRNIILVLGDGMGPQQLGLAELYSRNTKDKRAEPLSQFIGGALIGTHIPSAYDTLVNDSACSATQMARACMCKPRQIGMTSNGLPCESIFGDAKKRMLKVGLVSDTQITHATPAAFYAQVDERSSEQLIAEQLLESGIDLALSGGSALFLPTEVSCSTPECRRSTKSYGERTDGKNLLERARSRGFVVAQSVHELMEAQTTPLFGLFSPYFMNDAFNEGRDGQPSLAAMTRKALSLLDNPHGFFLMVEAGQIDLAAHHNDAGWVLSELLKLSDTLGAIQEFTERRDDTLVILTGDHETGGMGFSYYFPRISQASKGSRSSPHKAPDSDFVSTESLEKLSKQRAPVRAVVEAFTKLKASERTPKKLQELTLSAANLSLDADTASWFISSLNGATKSGSLLDVLITPYYPKGSALTALLGRAIGSQFGIVWATGTHTSTPISVFSTGPHSSSFQGVFQTQELGQRLKNILRN